MNKICFGCGSILQSVDENKPGFIPESKINDSKYCKRCFRLTHYGEISNNDIKKSTKSIIDNVNKSNDFKVFLVDILNVNNDTIDLYKKIIGKKVLVISKTDLIDKSINVDSVIDNIRKVYDIKEDIRLISNSLNSTKSFIKYLEKNNIKMCYILGPTNSGKSTLINSMIDLYNKSINKLTISNKRNTTLEFIRIKINEDLTIIDSPGFLLNDYNLKTNYKNIIRPITFNMKDNDVLNIDNFYIKCEKSTSVSIYCYEQIDTKKYYKDIDFNSGYEIDNNTDISINGFGKIRVKDKNRVYINNLDESLISINKSIMGGYYE